MLDMSKKLEHIRKRMDQISKEFDHIRTTLDWDVKAKGNIDRTFRRIDNTIEDISDCLGDHNRFVVKAHDTYLESESALAALTGDSENTLFKDSVQEVSFTDKAISWLQNFFTNLKGDIKEGKYLLDGLNSFFSIFQDDETDDLFSYFGAGFSLTSVGCEALTDWLRDGNFSWAEAGELITGGLSKIIKMPAVKEGISEALKLAEDSNAVSYVSAGLGVISAGFKSYSDQMYENGSVDGTRVVSDMTGKAVTTAVSMGVKAGVTALIPVPGLDVAAGIAAGAAVDYLMDKFEVDKIVSDAAYDTINWVADTGGKVVNEVGNFFSDCSSKVKNFWNSSKKSWGFAW
jgi:hypothetical protein